MSTELTNYKDRQSEQLAERLIVKEAVIASSGTTSGIVDCEGYSVVAIRWPAAFTGATATVQNAHDRDGTYLTVDDGAGTDLSLTVTASRQSKISADTTIGWQFIKLVSASSEGEERTIEVVLKAIN